MTDCLRVYRSESGVISMSQETQSRQRWEHIVSIADEVEDVGVLAGWGDWANLYKVRVHGDLRLYAVKVQE